MDTDKLAELLTGISHEARHGAACLRAGDTASYAEHCDNIRAKWEQVCAGSSEPGKQCVLIVGNLGDGHTFHGPFEDFDAADEASRDFNGDTWIAELHSAAKLEAARDALKALDQGD
jgi:hypothetical protein